jgi:hypothetical protein
MAAARHSSANWWRRSYRFVRRGHSLLDRRQFSRAATAEATQIRYQPIKMADDESVAAPPEVPSPAAIDRLARQQTEARYFEDLRSFGWVAIGRRIVLAGTLFPCVFALCMTAISFISALLNGNIGLLINPAAIFGSMIGIAAISTLGGAAALVWSGVTTLITLPVVHLAVWSMNIRADWLKLAAFSGGLVAFIATLPLSAELPVALNRGAPVTAFWFLTVVPALATIFGQYGGLSGGRRAVRQREAKTASRRALIAIGCSRFNFDQVGDEDKEVPAKFQFRISHMLWLGLWLSLMFTAIRLSGIGYELFLPVLLAWLLFQAVTLLLGGLIGRHLLPWVRAWRQSRST